MINLDTFCKQRILNRYILPKQSFKTFDEFLYLNDLTEETISEDAINFYYNFNINSKVNRNLNDYCLDIFEMLSTQSNDKIKNKLLSKFKCIDDINELSANESKFKPICINLNRNQQICVKGKSEIDFSLANTDEAKEFQHILDFYGYYITLIDIDLGNYIICIEPNKTDDEFENIRETGGYIYHITNKNLKASIEKTGLRPKVGKLPKDGGYRFFPERIYFTKHSKDKEQLKNNLQQIIKDKGIKDYIIVKVKLNEHKFPLYKDTSYDENNNIFTYTAIPPQLLTIYDNINDI